METTLILYDPNEDREGLTRIHAWFQIPKDDYDTQHEAMTHAHSVASRTKHRMKVYPTLQRMWRIKLGEGPLQ